ncbi:hypothetical protein ACLQ8T_15425 [Glutamicibacter sp. FR1]|uniref:hypothetical protein n=1 Tax=Glutamicibacter sp. FR1 TaxID=3393744 RepID=UPI0039AF46FA
MHDIPGEPGFAPINEAGGEGITGSNRFASSAADDGTELQVSTATTVVPWVLDRDLVRYFFDKLEPVLVNGTGGVIYARTAAGVDDDPKSDSAPDAVAPLKNSVWSLAAAAVPLLVFAGSLLLSSSYSPDAKLVPQLVGWVGVIMSGILLVLELRTRKAAMAADRRVNVSAAAYFTAPAETVPAAAGHAPSGTAQATAAIQQPDTNPGTGYQAGTSSAGTGRDSAWGPKWTSDASFALRTFSWMAGFLVLTSLVGYLAAISVFVPAFLLIVARAKLKTTIIYTAVLFILMLVLPSLLPIDLPQGLLANWL